MGVSLCDACTRPGACCQGFVLHFADGRALAGPPDERQAYAERHALPYTALPGDREWACSHLTGEGRCAIHEARPAVCRAYEAGSSQLCVMYRREGLQ